MGIVWFLNDPKSGESFELGKGFQSHLHPNGSGSSGLQWLSAFPHRGAMDCQGAAWRYIGRAFWWGTLSAFVHNRNQAATRLWEWIDGRDQGQLDITNDEGDDSHCRSHCDHDDPIDECIAEVEKRGGRHFMVTGYFFGDETRERHQETGSPNKAPCPVPVKERVADPEKAGKALLAVAKRMDRLEQAIRSAVVQLNSGDACWPETARRVAFNLQYALDPSTVDSRCSERMGRG